MNGEDAFDLIDRLVAANERAGLSDYEKAVFLGIWQGKTYPVIAEKISLTEQYVKEIANNKLFNKISKLSQENIKVQKHNFKSSVEKIYNQQSTQIINILPSTLELTNPFIPQQVRVEDANLFFGRKQEIQRIFELFNSGSSVVIVGEEGIGKSSLLWAICQQAENQLQRQSAFLDLNCVNDEEEFYQALCHEIGIPESKGYMLNRNLKDKRVLLAIDNVGKLTWQGFTRQVRDYLRGLAEGSNLRLALAATEPLDQLFNDSQDNGKTSPLAGICQEENIKLWDETSIRDLITSRLAMTSVRFTEEEIIQLIQQSGGHPRKLMQLCYQTYSRYLAGAR
ncbi:AAA family ATPase [Nostoc sp. LEGE 06077]|uniref:nSTAND1 domain-containing NTPase n=1 Tax=Nostoc sp. LEGE 06077 TaxID=915325 RepID=UPI00187F9490|nr:AAA family ATPase [Nostoc sp. LEGE 06077]MBE9209593.1 AAA family ATPase [Nostoc sp. LEGE 06077]